MINLGGHRRFFYGTELIIINGSLKILVSSIKPKKIGVLHFMNI